MFSNTFSIKLTGGWRPQSGESRGVLEEVVRQKVQHLSILLWQLVHQSVDGPDAVPLVIRL